MRGAFSNHASLKQMDCHWASSHITFNDIYTCKISLYNSCKINFVPKLSVQWLDDTSLFRWWPEESTHRGWTYRRRLLPLGWGLHWGHPHWGWSLPDCGREHTRAERRTRGGVLSTGKWTWWETWGWLSGNPLRCWPKGRGTCRYTHGERP